MALLKLDKPVVFTDTISPICLATQDTQLTTDSQAYLSGWGATSFRGPTQTRLLHAKLPLLTVNGCSQTYAEALRQANRATPGLHLAIRTTVQTL